MSLSVACTQPRLRASKRRNILDTAWIHFGANGFAGSSINAITREAGVSKESMYRYFAGKEDLFEAVLDRELTHHAQCVECLLESLDSQADDALLELARGVLALMCSHRTLVLRKLLGQKHPRLAGPAKHRVLHGSIERIHAAVERLLSKAAPATASDTATLAQYFMSMLLYRNILERDCSVARAPTEAELARLARVAVMDFYSAFMAP